jgi:hypothetical protein
VTLAGRLALVGLVAISSSLGAQDVRLASRLDPATSAAVAAVVDSARAAKLPTAPLVNKALEGAAKGSEGSKIVIAVRQLADRLGASRNVLGSGSTPDEVSAAAIALDAGISVHDLALLRSAAGKRTLTLPLAVLTDLVERHVPIATASSLVVSLARARLSDADLSTFERNVRFDIDRGADPSTAASTRARGIMLRASTASKPPRGRERDQ